MTVTDPIPLHCGPHGGRVAATICGHMIGVDGTSIGFIENSDDPNNLQAWCSVCEALYLQEGGMTAAFLEFNRMMVVCDVCYAEVRARHASPSD